MAEGLVLLVPSDLEGQLVLLDLRAMPVILVQRAIRVFEDPPVLLVPRALPDLREMLENVDQKGLGVFRVHPDPLVEELEEPRYLVQKAPEVPLALLDPRVKTVPPDLRVCKALPDQLVLPVNEALLERTVSPDPRAMLVQLDKRDPRVLQDRQDPLDLQESVVPRDRMRLLLSSTST